MKTRPSLLNAQLKLIEGLWPSIERAERPADRWLGDYFLQHRRKIGSRDRRFISEIVYSLFRNKTYLWLWAREAGLENNAYGLALMAAFLERQIGFREFDEIFRGLARGKYERFESEAFLGFRLPAWMQPSSEEERLALRYSFPQWLVERWTAAFGQEKVRELLEVFSERPPLSVRANPLKCSREALLKRLEKDGLEAVPAPGSPYGLVFRERTAISQHEVYKEGWLEIQDLASQQVCLAMGVRPGETVWDACAGGGGKSLLLAALMENKGRIVATDLRRNKLEELKKRAKRAGAFNIFPADLDRMNEIRQIRGGFDKILVDAPCSGTGTLRRNPDAKWKLSEERFLVHQKDQIAIIEKALPHLKKGGRIFYVTCSIERVENEMVMETVLARHPELALVKDLPAGEFTGTGFRLWPGRDNDGFFIAAADKI